MHSYTFVSLGCHQSSILCLQFEFCEEINVYSSLVLWCKHIWSCGIAPKSGLWRFLGMDPLSAAASRCFIDTKAQSKFRSKLSTRTTLPLKLILKDWCCHLNFSQPSSIQRNSLAVQASWNCSTNCIWIFSQHSVESSVKHTCTNKIFPCSNQDREREGV